ncbi:CHAP domain-containing protein [Pochonia chlamydosporia 170]|uniref:CHAP domain-containing protein n=1 Tax=Pochonia chlamydosporia 170 TaxID=1380566 RepID=A0A179F4E4_METCM|nr:CHAP domain-containing protein [Pochonia chlamydosporia 170]OAQ60240.1 CHAP domain-containing protein [Pochonia chlamydosporia 170]
MKFVTISALAISLGSSLVAAYPVTAETLNCRASPDTSSAIKKTYKKGNDVTITCQTEGPSINGNTIWDKTSDGCYVADYYVKTGSSSYVKDQCGGSKPPSGKIPGPMKDDYPYKHQCGPVDKWKYFKCQCTSFVAWRINDRLGIKFTNQYKGTNWGNANTWDEAARRTKVRVDNKPVPGCIAQSNGGKAGHVAWVTKVSGDKVTIEEYNWNKVQGYGTRTVPKGNFNYIHVKV